jgi:hypothetical protein
VVVRVVVIENAFSNGLIDYDCDDDKDCEALTVGLYS